MDLTLYTIERSREGGVPVYRLDGGMSAEYAVEKSLANLTGGVSHSWVLLPREQGAGPRPVMARPGFLRESAARTTALYDAALGADAPLDTVIFSSGVMPVSYLSFALKAPVLPMQYLAASHTVENIERLARADADEGIESYYTLGYDDSMRGVGVAWGELLAPPRAYIDFLERHAVRRVMIVGTTARNEGEVAVRRVLRAARGGTDVAPGDVYIMFPGIQVDENGAPRAGIETALSSIRRHVSDFDQTPLAPAYGVLSDWESGVEQRQIEAFSRLPGGRRAYALLLEKTTDMYLRTTRAMLLFCRENGELPRPRGIVMNPYLLAHPGAEAARGLIPFLYWQFTEPAELAARLATQTQALLNEIFPGVSARALPVYINATENFGGFSAQAIADAVRAAGFPDATTGGRVDGRFADEVFGEPSPCERALDILRDASVRRLLAGVRPVSPESLGAVEITPQI